MLEKIGIGILTRVVPRFLKKGWEHLKNRHQNSKNVSHDYKRPYKKRHGQLQVSCIGMEAQRSLEDVYVAIQFLLKFGDRFDRELRGRIELVKRIKQMKIFKSIPSPIIRYRVEVVCDE